MAESSGKFSQPDEAQELANAAYLLRMNVQKELARACMGTDTESIAFHIERWQRAVIREREADNHVKSG